MKSIIEHYTPIEAIPIPEHYFEIEIPSWDEVIEPLLNQVARQFKTEDSELGELTDDHIISLGLNEIQTVEQFKQYAMKHFEEEQIQLKFYHSLMPFILAFHGETAEVIINSEEESRYSEEYLEQVAAYANEYDLPLEAYAHQYLGIVGDYETELKQRAREDYIFKLIAHHIFETKNIVLDELTYENFIQQNVLQNGADEIDVREQFPYEVFKQIMPEMSYSQALFNHYQPKFRFKIKG